MKFLLLPEAPPIEDPESGVGIWNAATKMELGGYFYDRILDTAGNIVGVRYWVDKGVVFQRHPVFRLFWDDTRFRFNQDSRYVDMVFDEKNVDALIHGRLPIETTQDFGGEEVVKHQGIWGISFTF